MIMVSDKKHSSIYIIQQLLFREYYIGKKWNACHIWVSPKQIPNKLAHICILQRMLKTNTFYNSSVSCPRTVFPCFRAFCALFYFQCSNCNHENLMKKLMQKKESSYFLTLLHFKPPKSSPEPFFSLLQNTITFKLDFLKIDFNTYINWYIYMCVYVYI